MSDAYTVRRARASDVAILPEIERAAGRAFASVGMAAIADAEPTGAEAHALACRESRLLVVADENDAPVGFALFERLGECTHLEELSVHPDHGRRGLGRRLLEAVCDAAREAGERSVTLTTFREVPWNAPFYARAGFRTLDPDQLSPALAERRRREAEDGLALKDRVCMQRDL